jgi:hypothetical protein
MVPELGGTFSGSQMYSWKCLHIENSTRRRVSATINGRYLKKYYPSIEVDRWLQAPGLQASETQKQPTFEKEAAFRTKNPNSGDGQYLCVLPLAQNYSTLQMFLAGFYLTTQLLKITRGWEAEGLEEEVKQPGSFGGCHDLQLPSGCPRKPSSCCICQKHLKKGTIVECGIWA